jgi:hypothetical protein
MQPIESHPIQKPVNEPAVPARRVVSTTYGSPTASAARVVYVLFGILEGLIAIRLVLKLLAANPDAGFSAFIYAITDPFVAPFQGVFGTPVVHGSVFEFTALLAIIVYALIGWGIASLLLAAGRRQTTVTS